MRYGWGAETGPARPWRVTPAKQGAPNSRQRAVLAVGILAVLLLGLFPPCISSASSGGLEYPVGHRFVFSPAIEELSVGFMSYRIDYPRLAMLLGIVGLATLGGLVLFKAANSA